VIENWIDAVINPGKGLILILLLGAAVLLPYMIHYPVSVFRSANKYTGSGFWKWLAIIIAFLHGIQNIAGIFVLLPLIGELSMLLHA